MLIRIKRVESSERVRKSALLSERLRAYYAAMQRLQLPESLAEVIDELNREWE